MRKALALLLAVLMAVTILPITAFAASAGDIDGDGNITASDARLALRYSVGLEYFTSSQKANADVDGTSGITASDARLILRVSVGLDSLQQNFEPIVYTGSGDRIITNVTLPEGLYKISLSYVGTRNFIVVPYDGNGDRKSSWSNEIGSYEGAVIFSDSLSNGFIEVVASGTWTITISQDFGNGTSKLQGTGDCVSPFFTLRDGASVIKLLNMAESNFIVLIYDETGRRYSSLANEIGYYEGQTIFNKGDSNMKYCISVVSKGAWVVDFGNDSVTTYVTPG